MVAVTMFVNHELWLCIRFLFFLAWLVVKMAIRDDVSCDSWVLSSNCICKPHHVKHTTGLASTETFGGLVEMKK